MNRYIRYILILLAVGNIVFLLYPFNQWIHMLISTNMPVLQSRQMQAIKYTGFEEVMHFIQFDSTYRGDIAIVPLEKGYTERFNEFFILSALSDHKVYYAPVHILLNSTFFNDRDISRMVLLHDNDIVVVGSDSLWSDQSRLIRAQYKNGILKAQWFFKPYQHMRIYLFDIYGHYLADIPVPANPYGDTLNEIERSMELEHTPYFWTISKMSMVNFNRNIGYVSF